MAKGKIKMVVTDLDDTLLSPEKEICVDAVGMIKTLKEKGVNFTFITGRPPFAIKRFAEKVCISAPIVACNGAILMEKCGEIQIEGSGLPLAPLEDLLNRAKDQGLTVLILAGEIEYALAKTDWTRSREESGREVPIVALTGLLKEKTIYKVNIMAHNAPEKFSLLIPQIQAFERDYSIAVYGNTGCEIVAKSVNKKTGLLKICDLCKVEPKDVLAIGDNENDIQMLQTAGIGVAVGNATEATKASADYVCENTYTKGVMEAIDKFVLE